MVEHLPFGFDVYSHASDGSVKQLTHHRAAIDAVEIAAFLRNEGMRVSVWRSGKMVIAPDAPLDVELLT